MAVRSPFGRRGFAPIKAGVERAAEERLVYHGVEAEPDVDFGEAAEVLGRLDPTPRQEEAAKTGLWESFVVPVLAVGAGVAGIAALAAGARRTRREGLVEVVGREPTAEELRILGGEGSRAYRGYADLLSMFKPTGAAPGTSPAARGVAAGGKGFWEWTGKYLPDLLIAGGVATGAIGAGVGAAAYGVGQIVPDITITQAAPSISTAQPDAAPVPTPMWGGETNWALAYAMS